MSAGYSKLLKFNRSLARAVDNRILRIVSCDIISSCQSAVTYDIEKRF